MEAEEEAKQQHARRQKRRQRKESENIQHKDEGEKIHQDEQKHHLQLREKNDEYIVDVLILIASDLFLLQDSTQQSK